MRSRRDINEREIIKGLRDIGATVEQLAPRDKIARVPDLLVGWAGMNFLFEVKRPGQELREKQEKWHNAWKGQCDKISSLDEALEKMRIKNKTLRIFSISETEQEKI